MRYVDRRIPDRSRIRRPAVPDLSDVRSSNPQFGLSVPFFPAGEEPERTPASLLDDMRMDSVSPTDETEAGADRSAPAEDVLGKKEYQIASFTSTDRVYDLSSTSVTEVGKVLATLISDLADRGLVRLKKT